MLNRIDHIVLPVTDLTAAAAAFERLGLRLTPVTRHEGRGTANRALFVGQGENDVYIELLAVHDREAAIAAGRRLYVEAIYHTAGATLIALASDAIAADAARIPAAVESVTAEGGRKLLDVALLPETPAAVMPLSIVQYPESPAALHARRAADGRFDHAFPLKRLDHLAAVVPDPSPALAYWEQSLGIPVWGEVPTPVMVIKQLKIGDAIMEFLCPTGPDSPLASRPPGLISMAAFEVPDLDAAVALARERGFTPSDPATGVLPGTRTATIPGSELAGLALQLLQYV
jgi:catechol 2,3-dioxygenase-like lactoylglutathione lyase family enzyme